MNRFWIVMLLLVVGCNQTPTLSPSSALGTGSDLADTSSTPSTPAAAVADPARAASDEDSILTIGSPAPALKVNRFLKGKPVTAFEPRKIYVVEFWATWCGPCVQAMPHVTALQKQYPEVTFIGVNVWEEDESVAEAFLKQQGAKIDYRIARDDIPEGGDAHDGAMAVTWLKAAGIGGIPTAFVVDGHGRIANITHPMSLDESLPQIIDGTWNPEEASKQHRAETAERRHAAEFKKKLRSLVEAEPTDETFAALDQLATEFPGRAPIIGLMKFRKLLSADGKTEQALAEGRKLLRSDLASQPEFLGAIAWDVVDPNRNQVAAPELLAFALKTIKLADEKTQQRSPAIADTLARVFFLTGDAKAAADAQSRAVSLAKKTPGMEAVVNELTERLTEYEEAAATTAKKPE